MLRTVVALTWCGWLAFGAFVATSAMVLGQEQSRNVLIAVIAVAGATLWWAFSRSATSARQGWLVAATGILNGLFLLLAVGLIGAACIRVFGEGYAVFG